MPEVIKFYIIAILIVAPLYIFIIKLIFKKSILTRMGVIMIALTIAVALITFTIEFLNLPRIIGVPLRLAVVLAATLLIRREVKLLQKYTKQLTKISNLDLNIDVDKKDMKRGDEMSELAIALHKMQTELQNVVMTLRKNTKYLSDLSTDLKKFSDDLSQGVDVQANNTDSILAAIEQMAAAIQSNTEKAVQTEKISEQAARDIEANFRVFMKTIESVNEISKKIKIIDDLARRTDLLSVNASLEASKAGKSGKGFGVVADEIRKFADSSKKASSHINSLSKQTRQASEEARKKLHQIVPEIIKTSKLNEDIVVASKEQENNISLINKSLIELSNITANTSSSANEMSNAAQILAEQAEELHKIMMKFKLKQNNEREQYPEKD